MLPYSQYILRAKMAEDSPTEKGIEHQNDDLPAIPEAADVPELECQAIVKIPLPARPGTVLVEA